MKLLIEFVETQIRLDEVATTLYDATFLIVTFKDKIHSSYFPIKDIKAFHLDKKND